MIRCTLLLLFISHLALAQMDTDLPYATIPDVPSEFTAGNMAARMVDGLGFRFYWATEGLSGNDITYRPHPETRDIRETVDHIHSMVLFLHNVVFPGTEPLAKSDTTFTVQRTEVLKVLWKVSQRLRESQPEELETYVVTFRDGRSLPFWNFINGPIADCIWHCGQIVSHRRAAGNPFNSKVSLFEGKVRE